MTKLLFENNINIYGSVTNDSAEYGIVRLIVSDTDKAKKAFTAAGYMCKLDNVIGIEIDDKPGALDSILKDIEDANININYTYVTFGRQSNKPVVILSAEDLSEIEDNLKSKGYVSVNPDCASEN